MKTVKNIFYALCLVVAAINIIVGNYQQATLLIAIAVLLEQQYR